MYVLGIETSCDETSAAVIKDGRKVLSNITLSSLREHQKFGGIIPEIASRRQLECIYPVVQRALEEAKCSMKRINFIAVTEKPGLIGSLLVGTSFAKAISYAFNKPMINVNHIEAHLYANFLYRENRLPAPKLPAIGLVVSGGHTSLYRISKSFQYHLLGQTRDDAAGEAFDKVSRILNLGYPGGPAIEKQAQRYKKTSLSFTCNPFPDTLDFSFSGIKTAVLYHHRDDPHQNKHSKGEVAQAFQTAVIHSLVKKSIRACQSESIQTLLIGGGVAANQSLRQLLRKECDALGITLHVPEMTYCLDNAAMIAGLGTQMAQQNY